MTETRLRDPVNRLSKRAITLWILDGLAGYVILVGGAAVVASWIDGSKISWLPSWLITHIWWAPIVLGVVGSVFVLVQPFWRYAVHRWELTDDVVYARSGWIQREWVFVPVSRIQTVDKTQGLFERMLNLATLEIRTASYAGSTSIKGLDYETSARLAAELAYRAHELRDDAT